MPAVPPALPMLDTEWVEGRHVGVRRGRTSSPGCAHVDGLGPPSMPPIIGSRIGTGSCRRSPATTRSDERRRRRCSTAMPARVMESAPAARRGSCWCAARSTVTQAEPAPAAAWHATVHLRPLRRRPRCSRCRWGTRSGVALACGQGLVVGGDAADGVERSQVGDLLVLPGRLGQPADVDGQRRRRSGRSPCRPRTGRGWRPARSRRRARGESWFETSFSAHRYWTTAVERDGVRRHEARGPAPAARRGCRRGCR